MSQTWKAEVWEYVKSLALAAVMAAVIMIFIAQSFAVHGSSMEPTLHNGERLFIEKVTYRLRPPERGDIVVFNSGVEGSRYPFIKRVVGEPGDTVEIKDHRLYVNGNEIEEGYINGKMYETFGPVVVPEGKLFVLGDNRNNSMDSRFPQVGFVPKNKVIGRAILRYWPLGRAGLMHSPEALDV